VAAKFGAARRVYSWLLVHVSFECYKTGRIEACVQVLVDRQIPLYAWPEGSGQPAARFARKTDAPPLDYLTWKSQAFQDYELLSMFPTQWVDLDTNVVDGAVQLQSFKKWK
jgi:hypothetical protein